MSSFASTPTKVTWARLAVYRKVAGLQLVRRNSTRASTNVVNSDIVIVGGGPAGLALASALGSSSSLRKNVSVTLVEGGDLTQIKSWNPPPESFSNRVSSLTNTSRSFLQDIGAWSYVDETRTCQVEQLQVWDGISDARIEFSSNDLPSTSSMARLTENLNLQRGLLRHLDNIPEIQVLQKTKVTSIENDSSDRGGWPLVHLDNETTLRARLLVGADGFNSPVRQFAQIPSFGWAYDTQAIVATLNHFPRGAYEGPNTTGYQRFLPTGPIAFLPLSPSVSSLVWSTKPPIAKALLASDPGVLSCMINAAFRLPYASLKYLQNRIVDAHAAGTPLSPDEIREEIQWREHAHGIDQNSAYSCRTAGITNQGIPPADSEMLPPLVLQLQSGTMASFPLRFNHAESYIGDGSKGRTVLVGDAAHTIHPLAGQGLNLGLADAECLARCIQNSILSGGDIGSYTALLPYTQERYLANHTVMSACDKLHKLYSMEDERVVWVRSVGVEVLNELDSIKAAMMMTAGARQSARNSSMSSTGWALAGDAVASLSSGIQTAGTIGRIVGNYVDSVVGKLARK
ncbi:Ubiquinone biosynthesis monooxygenase COQ6, mitochondrial [Psilocybe cubensis]|uniref:Ubiquinone biosynthesis monooxygenase COQ6, mitochondrial n=2 Tax=Psilocybe cubensis TaxID=181762 RepID=A0A8H8CI84_PSICU|nr:Ubiquinone biosynthesis monooxygenase COQ6, mitochondrial [Psilocybe cubensis]KAH9479448.1 Ubiquinone biosynthesis monooxygenase COQ6, mitochondrial [Psilocybe cubensis]